MLRRMVRKQVGLQLYSLRDQFSSDVLSALRTVRRLGIENVELAGTYHMAPGEFRRHLDAQGLRPVSSHVPFEQFRDSIDDVVQEARTLGVHYAGCAWLPHEYPFDEKACRRVTGVFNRAGEALAAHGVRFFYHPHGYEFQPHGDGTLFDLMVAESIPEFVSFELDPFWVLQAGYDPLRLLESYNTRIELLHLKDMKKGAPTGILTGHSETSDDEALGAGSMDWRALLAAADAAGIRWYFLEDESPSSAEHIPQSLRYLESVRF